MATASDMKIRVDFETHSEILQPVLRGEISAKLRDELEALKLKSAMDPLATVGKKTSTWIQLARTGAWRGHSSGEFTFDAETYGEMVKNFSRNRNGEVPLDFEHASEAGYGGSIAQAGAPAQGWIKELRFTDDALEGRVEWVDGQPGLQYVRDGAYKYISPAVIFESVDRVTGKAIGAELTSAALTNRPFLDGMKPLAARHRAGANMSTTDSELAKALADKKAQLEEEDDADKDAKAKKAKAKLEKEGDEGAEVKAKSAKATDGRTPNEAITMSAPMSFGEITSEICEALNLRFGRWTSYVTEVYDDTVVYSKGDDFFRIGYSINEQGEAELVGKPTQVRRVYEPIPTESENGETLMATSVAAVKKMNAALGLSEEASETALMSAFEARESKMVELTAKLAKAEERNKALFSAVGLDERANDADFIKRVTELVSSEAEYKKVEPEIRAFRDEKAAYEKKIGEAEVDFVIKMGAQYGTPVHETARKSLMFHRKSEPTDFAETYKAALDGMKAGDAPHLFSRVTAAGGPLATTPTRAATNIGPDSSNTAFEAEVDRELATAKQNGVTLSRNEARSRAHSRLFSAATNSH